VGRFGGPNRKLGNRLSSKHTFEQIETWHADALRGDGGAQAWIEDVYYSEEDEDSLTDMAEQGDVVAQYVLATIYFEGERVPRDEREGGRWLRSAAGRGYSPAKRYLKNLNTPRNGPESTATRSEGNPGSGYGIIYILSNPTMPGIFKVGLTTNSVNQRIKELNTTSVPQPFKAERIFEIEARHLREVEQLAHKKLKNRGFHQGKEFFSCALVECNDAVEDSILELTNHKSEDLVGKAARRAAAAKTEADEERLLKEQRRSDLEAKEKRLEIVNQEISTRRTAYLQELRRKKEHQQPALDRFIVRPIQLASGVILGFLLLAVDAPLGMFAIPALFLLTALWIIRTDRNEIDSDLKNKASRALPFKNLEDID
jgi:hypothetical protein